MEQKYINSFFDSFDREEELPLEENIQDPFDQYHKHEMTLNYFSRSLNENEEDELKPKNILNSMISFLMKTIFLIENN